MSRAGCSIAASIAAGVLVLALAACGGAKPAAAPAAAPLAGATPVEPGAPAAPAPAPAAAPSAPAAGAPFDKSGIADWTQAPAPGTASSFTPPVAKRSVLKNGATLLVIENHTLPIAALEILIPGAGAAGDPLHKRGLAAFTADVVDEGAGGLSALAVSEEAARLGAAIITRADTDAARISVRALARTLDPTLALLAKIVTQPAFDPAELDRVKGDRLTALDQRRDRPREVAQIVLDGALYGAASQYGHPVPGVRDDVKTFSAADVKAFYRAHWTPKLMTIVVAGDVDAAAITRALDAAIGGWKPTGDALPDIPRPKAAKLAQRLLLVDRPGAAQSDVRIGNIGPDIRDRGFHAFEVLRTVLGDGFTSRLTQRLREQLGITYGAGAGMMWHWIRGTFVIATAIVTAKTATGVSETFQILDDLAAKDVGAEELDKAKQNLIRAMPARFETNAEIAAAFADLALHRLPDNWYAGFAAAVSKVTAAEVRAAAKALIPSGAMAISIVGDASVIRPELDRLGLGAPAMFDLEGAPVAATPAAAPAR
jgi:zinc protease